MASARDGSEQGSQCIPPYLGHPVCLCWNSHPLALARVPPFIRLVLIPLLPYVPVICLLALRSSFHFPLTLLYIPVWFLQNVCISLGKVHFPGMLALWFLVMFS